MSPRGSRAEAALYLCTFKSRMKPVFVCLCLSRAMSGFYLDAEPEEASEVSPTRTSQAVSMHFQCEPPLCLVCASR